MGEPVRILDLASRFIAAHGLTPELPDGSPAVDAQEPRVSAGRIPVSFTGVRPGEKLDEELAHAGETLRPTLIPGILAWQGPDADPNQVERMVSDLGLATLDADPQPVLAGIGRWIPGFARAEPAPAPIGT